MNRPDVDTWYVLADGTKADPADVSAGDDGVLKHSNGVPVALRENGLALTTGDANRENAMAADAGKGTATLADMTVAQLKDLAVARGVDLGEATKKADIIAAIEGSHASPTAADRQITAGAGTKTYETR